MKDKPLIEKISTYILFGIFFIPMLIAAFTTSLYFGVPFALVFVAGIFRRYRGEQ